MIPGGSSGGSGAALAARLCLGSLGTDTGGSIRIPAALCGVVGLKPTYGRVSLRGVIPLSWNLDHAGPMARSVRDAALLLQVIAGYDPLDPGSIDVPTGDYLEQLESGVSGWRVALASDAFFTEVTDPEVWNAVREAAHVFASLGAVVEEVPFPDARQAALANGLMTTSDGAAFHRERLQSQPELFGEDIRQRLQTGAAYTSSEYALARHTQTVLQTPVHRLLRSVRYPAHAHHAGRCATHRRAERGRAGAPADPLHGALQPDRAAGALPAVRFFVRRAADRIADRLPTVG